MFKPKMYSHRVALFDAADIKHWIWSQCEGAWVLIIRIWNKPFNVLFRIKVTWPFILNFGVRHHPKLSYPLGNQLNTHSLAKYPYWRQYLEFKTRLLLFYFSHYHQYYWRAAVSFTRTILSLDVGILLYHLQRLIKHPHINQVSSFILSHRVRVNPPFTIKSIKIVILIPQASSGMREGICSAITKSYKRALDITFPILNRPQHPHLYILLIRCLCQFKEEGHA